MMFWLALRRLLPLLAVFSLALTPVTAPAATARMHGSMAGHHTVIMASHGMTQGHMHHAAVDRDETTSVGMADMGMDDMPCCPKSEATKPDCPKGCPLMALCLASVASLLPTPLPVPVPVASRMSVSWPNLEAFASVHGTPLPEPPRA
ncbi:MULTISPECIES: hypothetical protein [unclassified Methylobacterium]|uniref:hypothetical protein n=1 Tax=unclassified Methylobacterium TaxID=2615210 RepID=UPI00226AD8FE